MAKTVEYYFTPVSPWAYLGAGRFRQIAEKHRAEVKVRPVDFGVIFPETGGLPLNKRPKARQDFRLQELKRWSAFLGQAINLHPKHFPCPEQLAARAIIATDLTGGDALKVAEALGRACWVDERNLADEGTVQAVIDETGHHGLAVMARALDPETNFVRERYTREALERGVFGSPTYLVEGEVLWGQDRLDFVERYLSKA